MQLHVIGTGSKGNCYLLEGETSALIIECGMPFLEVKKALDFKLEKIAGCLVSHIHGDHFKFNREYINAGIDVFMELKYCEEAYQRSHRIRIFTNKKTFTAGEFTVHPFDVEHDVPTSGFLINHPECGNVLFLTDTVFCRYNFPDLNQVIIEANYSDSILNNKPEGIKFVRDRVINSHMELGQCIRTLRANNLTGVNNIVLIHLSDSNSHEEIFKAEVEAATGKNVTVASNGMKINFNLTPF